MMLSVDSLKPAILSLKAMNVPEKPMAVNARELLAVKEKMLRMEPTSGADKPRAIPFELLRVAVSAPGQTRMEGG
ncbi:MAG: hypothetical protein RLZZ117_427 [Cyanobacteriota bacterium]|jgi:hypothetical protein